MLKATRERIVEEMQEKLNARFKACPFKLQEKLFDALVLWANEGLGDEERDMFLDALFNAKETQAIVMLKAVDEAVKQIMEEEKIKNDKA